MLVLLSSTAPFLLCIGQGDDVTAAEQALYLTERGSRAGHAGGTLMRRGCRLRRVRCSFGK
jgi:hypothetical protein